MPITLDRPGGSRVLVYPPQATNPAAPVPRGGDLYYNTTIDEYCYYDDFRAKWLSATSLNVQAGRNGTTPANAFFRGVNGMLLDAANRGFSVPQGTVVGLSIVKVSAALTTIEVLVNGATVVTIGTGGAGNTSSFFVNADFPAGIMSFRNAAAGSAVSNAQITLWYKRRP